MFQHSAGLQGLGQVGASSATEIIHTVKPSRTRAELISNTAQPHTQTLEHHVRPDTDPHRADAAMMT